jgi:hypothetical protein
LYTSCMLRGAFTLFIKFTTYQKKKSGACFAPYVQWKYSLQKPKIIVLVSNL